MENKLKKFGGDMEQQMNVARSQMGNIGESIGNFGGSIGNAFQQQVGNIENAWQHQFGGNMDQHLSTINTHLGHIGDNFDNFGTSLISQFDRSFSHNFNDVFGMFGRQSTPWWKKENVCVKREVLEEDDDEVKNVNIHVS